MFRFAYEAAQVISSPGSSKAPEHAAAPVLDAGIRQRSMASGNNAAHEDDAQVQPEARPVAVVPPILATTTTPTTAAPQRRRQTSSSNMDILLFCICCVLGILVLRRILKWLAPFV